MCVRVSVCFCELISDIEKDHVLNISDNNGESSSIFEFGEHKEMHSNVHFAFCRCTVVIVTSSTILSKSVTSAIQ